MARGMRRAGQEMAATLNISSRVAKAQKASCTVSPQPTPPRRLRPSSTATPTARSCSPTNSRKPDALSSSAGTRARQSCLTPGASLVAIRHEHVAHAPDGLDIARLGRIGLDHPAQAGYLYVDGAL